MPCAEHSLRFLIPGRAGLHEADVTYEFVPATLAAVPLGRTAAPVAARKLLDGAVGVLVLGYEGHWPLNTFIGPAMDADQILDHLYWIATGRPRPAPGRPRPTPETACATDPATA